MNATRRLRRSRGALLAAAALSALLWALGVALAALALLVALDAAFGVPPAVRGAAVTAASLLGAAAFLARAWLSRGAGSLAQVALWLEARRPALRYALVTLADPGVTRVPPELESVVAGESWRRDVALATLRGVAAPLLLVAAALVALRALPAAAVEWAGDTAPREPGGAAERRRDRLSPLVATVTPPAYTGLRAVEVREPASLAGIEGSAVLIEGRGLPAGIQAQLGERVVEPSEEGRGWRVTLTMPDAPAALRLSDGPASRVIVLEPRPDSLPVVTLLSPARDTVLRLPPRGGLRLAAETRDDIGLASFRFEIIVSSGELETFTSRSAVVGADSLGGARNAQREAVLPLDSLRLAPGDVLHVRAVASDVREPWPGRGASETRTWRVIRTGEYDSLALEGAPPTEGDTSLISQRMLILLAEALERRRPRLERPRVLAESRDIARDQARLRRRVADIVFMRLGEQPFGEEVEGDTEDRPRTPDEVLRAAEAAATRATAGEPTDFGEDETPIVAINRPLLEAYNAMWDAGRELDLGEPDDALPFMRTALAAVQRARLAERVYLRGRPPRVVVDLRRVRLSGDVAGALPAGRAPREPDRSSRAALAARFERAVALALAGSAAATDSFQLLRVDALAVLPAAAAALEPVVRALRAGSDATLPLLRARRAFTGAAVRAVPGLPAWSEAW